MTTLRELCRFLDHTLNINSFPSDKSNNGLQVEGNHEVKSVVGGVDACYELYDKAAAYKADFIFVHHGESWGAGWRYLTGVTARRLNKLFQHRMSLYAAHLPLDAHLELGHNAQIARQLKLADCQGFACYDQIPIGICGTLPAPTKPEALAQAVNVGLKTICRIYDFEPKTISRVGIISGSGLSALSECQALNLDCLITGECHHTHYHLIQEAGIAVIIAGHYKTEIPGVLAVLDLLRQQFKLQCHFFDIPTDM